MWTASAAEIVNVEHPSAAELVNVDPPSAGELVNVDRFRWGVS